MSVAFTKEGDTENAAAIDLPDKPISPHRNLVTARGLAQLDAALRQARDDYTAHQGDAGAGGDTRALARAARDLRYLAARRATAEVVEPPTDLTLVRFGCRVTLERADGRRQVLRLVGEDEADPRDGTLSYVSPLATKLLGKGRSDSVTVAGAEIIIIIIDID